MEQIELDRLSALARKAKETGLEEDERLEQEALRAAYLLQVRQNLRGQLENTYVVAADGTEVKLERKSNG